MLLKEIKHNLETVGEIRKDDNGIVYYQTERDCHKNQIYQRKRVFLSDDSKEWYSGDNCVAISVDICKTLLANEVKYVNFIIKNFPDKGYHFLARIDMLDFLNKSITIQERGCDKQRITAMNNLQMIKRL